MGILVKGYRSTRGVGCGRVGMHGGVQGYTIGDETGAVEESKLNNKTGDEEEGRRQESKGRRAQGDS